MQEEITVFVEKGAGHGQTVSFAGKARTFAAAYQPETNARSRKGVPESHTYVMNGSNKRSNSHALDEQL